MKEKDADGTEGLILAKECRSRTWRGNGGELVLDAFWQRKKKRKEKKGQGILQKNPLDLEIL